MVGGERGKERDTEEVRDRHIHTAIFKMDKQQSPNV